MLTGAFRLRHGQERDEKESGETHRAADDKQSQTPGGRRHEAAEP